MNTTTLDTEKTERPSRKKRAADKEDGKLQMLGFRLAGRNFGLDIDTVIEIVRQVAVTGIPEAPEYVEGIIDIREKVVPLINLQKMLRIGDRDHDIETQIIIVYGENGVVGLLVDEVSDIVPVSRSAVMFPGRSTSPLSQFVSGVIDTNDDLTLLLDVDLLVDHKKWGDITTRPVKQDTDQDVETRVDQQILRERALELKKVNEVESFERRRLVTFALGEEWYGIDIAHVKEITDVVDIYFIPSAPAHFAGAINLRGVIIPVADLNAFLGLGPTKNADEKSIIVIEQNNVTMGILADQIGDIEEVASESVAPPLTTIDKKKVDCLEGGVELNGNLLGVLRLENIVQVTADPLA